MFYTYIIYSPSIDQYYTGYTSHAVEHRLMRHNSGSSTSIKAAS
ncbi:GIY-YIG nuclease family protein [Fodinibius salsisoli]|uniref:GIY-YIG nuclease family protein n=1 Tax=Fodinibius salsisoli TaxID=2820877 RepID=A0ABT3PN27_9BACT|nr:GIY-YIG nuclease family protein [Fodinibius salsisoli]